MNEAYALAVHGGAGTIRRGAMSAGLEAEYHAGLRRALEAGRAILAAGGGALDAVTAAVVALEDDPLFNAGRGAVFTAAGTQEMDAAVMDGRDRRAGAVAGDFRTEKPDPGGARRAWNTRRMSCWSAKARWLSVAITASPLPNPNTSRPNHGGRRCKRPWPGARGVFRTTGR